MAKIHKTKQTALTAARKARGDTAVEGIDFQLRNTGAGWEHEDMPPANEGAKAKRTAKAAAAPKPQAEKKKAPGPKPNKVVEGLKDAVAGNITRTTVVNPAATKTAHLVGMMQRPEGATSKDMEAATGWASHSVRGLLGTLKKKGTAIESVKAKGQPVVYKIATLSPAEPVGDVI